MTSLIFKSLTVIFISFFLSSCVGFLAGPGGVTCSAGDINTGGGNEAGAMSDAMRNRCTGNARPERVNSCCFKSMLFFTRSCSLRSSLPEGGDCVCVLPNPYPYPPTLVPGLACDT